jgi:hypothetical protein
MMRLLSVSMTNPKFTRLEALVRWARTCLQRNSPRSEGDYKDNILWVCSYVCGLKRLSELLVPEEANLVFARCLKTWL